MKPTSQLEYILHCPPLAEERLICPVRRTTDSLKSRKYLGRLEHNHTTRGILIYTNQRDRTMASGAAHVN